MCGIVGIWNINGSQIDQEELDCFTDSLKHRGPDGRGTYIDTEQRLALGHRRLAILDLTDSGHQPMSYGNGRFWISYNGEIYNFLELRKELEELGHHFRSESDTEVILASYAQWSEACQFKFNGMWGFAIWDSQERSLFLSRDRFGVKPLFYLYDGRHFLFASELKAFMALKPPLRPDFDLGMLAHLANAESMVKTIIKGVKNLNGGFQLVLRHGRSPEVKKWWRTSDHLVDVPNSFEDQVEQYRELFLDACRIRMRSDVPIGTALSGGLDSSSVLCSMASIKSGASDGQRSAKDWQKAFVFDYTGTSHSEKHHATEVIRYTGAVPIYKSISLSGISPRDIIQSTFYLEAVQDPSIGPWYIYREMRNKGVVVSLDGHGGDETLAGYSYYPAVAMRDAIWPWSSNERFSDLQHTLQGIIKDKEEVPDGFYDFSIPSRMDVVKTFLPNMQRLRQSVIQLLLSTPSLYNILRWAYRKWVQSSINYNHLHLGVGWNLVTPVSLLPIKKERLSRRFFDNLNKKLYHDFHIDILPRILRNFDRLSMAHGVEIRAPFMDWRLVTYAFSLPSNAKLGKGFTKLILRESMRGILPQSIRIRKSKIGFASPQNEWYKNVLKPFVLDSINSQEFLESEIWNGPVIRDFVEDCYRREDYSAAARSWKYIQAMILMRSFHDQAKSYDIYGNNQ